MDTSRTIWLHVLDTGDPPGPASKCCRSCSHYNKFVSILYLCLRRLLHESIEDYRSAKMGTRWSPYGSRTQFLYNSDTMFFCYLFVLYLLISFICSSFSLACPTNPSNSFLKEIPWATEQCYLPAPLSCLVADTPRHTHYFWSSIKFLPFAFWPFILWPPGICLFSWCRRNSPGDPVVFSVVSCKRSHAVGRLPANLCCSI